MLVTLRGKSVDVEPKAPHHAMCHGCRVGIWERIYQVPRNEHARAVVTVLLFHFMYTIFSVVIKY